MVIIRLMPDYFCFPLWGTTSENLGDIDPKSLPISQSLQSRLLEWAKWYDSILDMNDPASARFSTKEEEEKFVQVGAALANSLQNELGNNYQIKYFYNGDPKLY